MNDNNNFDLLNVNLDGSHLLEAGAGTGKTYSLSFLYLRLLLEPIKSANPLKVDEIVVATFTNTATAELKERIYARLCEAENILLQLDQKKEVIGDETLITYLSDVQKNTENLTLQRRLRLAQAQFDHAHIYSINAFALHLLSEHSITLGQPAPKDILDDDTQLIKNIYLQLAHNNFVEFGDSANAIGKTVAEMASDKLYQLLAAMHNHYDKLKKAEQYFPDYQAAKQTFNEITEQLCCNTDELRAAVDLLNTAIENKWLSKTIYNTDSLSVYTEKLFNRENYQPSDEKFLQFFSAQQLETKLLKAGKTAGITFDNPVFTQFNQLLELSSIVNKAESAEQYQHLMTLLSVIRSHLDDEKAKQMALTHDDIVHIVAAGADKLQLPFKAALLDEAQDTNKNQLEIFKKLFLQRGGSCFFVGDPKQAIYGFRGGDVYTYLAMQKQVQHRHILPKNYRSTQAVNDCINTLFADNPFARNSENTIDYHQIASDKDNQLSDFGDKSLSLVTADGTSADSLAETAADYLAHLLHSNIHITDKDDRRPLQYGDIAVLVRSGSQVERMQKALAQRGITASYTGKNSVYSTNEVVLMYALITAISESKTRQIKSLMLSPLFDYDTDAVLDDEIVNQLRQDFWDYANLYQQRGFAVMFYRLMHDYRIGGRLLQLTDGKRRLSNWIQLFELLQSALQNQSLTLLGLSEWLLRKISQHDKESELRLEDQNAISIMTMHKSKGLEFKVVFLPFFNYHREQGKSALDLLVSQQHELAAMNGLDIQAIKDFYHAEQQAEDMRLAYVALTRTTYHNIIIEQPIEKNKNGTDKKNASRTNSLWQRLLGDTAIAEYHFTQVIDEIPKSTISYTDNDNAQPKVTVLSLTKDLQPKWKMTSFSGLLQQMTAHSEVDTVATKSNLRTDTDSTSSVLISFPAGPKAGVLLHSLYEHYMENRCVDDRFIAYVDDLLKQSRLPTDTDSLSLASAIADTAKIALHPQAFCLNDIDKAQQSIEMEFFIHLTPSQHQHLYQHFGQSVSPIVEGYLQGFIDYCFSYENKFYVLDYKSNKLGDSLADFHQDAMQNAMDEHRYDLQALIYTLALCKHLGIDNQADYEQLIGGYYYLFIRGMTDDCNTPSDNGIYYRCVDWDLLALLL